MDDEDKETQGPNDPMNEEEVPDQGAQQLDLPVQAPPPPPPTEDLMIEYTEPT